MYSLLHSDKVSTINQVCQNLSLLYPTEPTCSSCGKLLTLVLCRAWLGIPTAVSSSERDPCGTTLNIKYQTL